MCFRTLLFQVPKMVGHAQQTSLPLVIPVSHSTDAHPLCRRVCTADLFVLANVRYVSVWVDAGKVRWGWGSKGRACLSSFYLCQQGWEKRSHQQLFACVRNCCGLDQCILKRPGSFASTSVGMTHPSVSSRVRPHLQVIILTCVPTPGDHLKR